MGGPVELAVGGVTRRGHLATGGGAGPALIVLGELGDSFDRVADVCDRFAAEGFTALAPEHGRTSGARAERGATTIAVELERAAQEVSGAVDFLLEHPAVRGRGAGVVGFSTGGGVALWLASIRPDRVRAVVPFCGTVPRDGVQPDWRAMAAAVEGHYAEDDDRAGPEAVRTLEETFGQTGRDVRLFLYPGTSHAFFDDTRPDVYDDDAARQAWVRTLEFLRSKLG
jgi:carboxymethylenebutenolidase